MNTSEETTEKLDEMEPLENDGHDEAENSEDLARKKRETNEFNAHHNTAATQIFVQTMHYMPDRQSSSSKDNCNRNKNYDLRNIEECTEFVETFKDGEYLTIAIILCTFEAVLLGDLPDLKSKLMEYLPQEEVPRDEERENIPGKNQDSYLSLNTILSVIGGKRFVTAEGQPCIGLGEESNIALVNIWEQFPALRNAIVSWLIYLSQNYEYRTNFDAYQITTAFVRVVALDFLDAEKRIFPQLYQHSDNVGLLGALAYRLYDNEEIRDGVESILLQWIKTENIWLWKSACLVYSYCVENGRQFPFDLELKKAIKKRFLYFRRNDLAVIIALLFESRHFRTMFTEIFYDIHRRADTRKQKDMLAQTYIYIIRRSYYQVNASSIELPLVACDTKEQQKKLVGVIEQVMSDYVLRKKLYVILEAYLKEISHYELSGNIVNHISAYFYNMSLTDFEYQQDVMDFLKTCNNKVSHQIYFRLYKTDDERGEISK